MNLTITLRPEQPEDTSFVFQLFSETRLADIASLPWSESQKETFLQQQFALQVRHYRTTYSAARFSIIQHENMPKNMPIGRFYVDRSDHEIRVIDITIAPAYRARGIGSELLQSLVSEARTTGQAVRLHVERRNQAMRLYERLGFRQILDTGVYVEMEWLIAS